MKGNFSLCYPHGGGPRVVRINVEDESSRINFLELEITFEEFTASLSSLANRPCEFILRGTQNVGKVIERKDIEIAVPDCKCNATARREAGDRAVAPFEVDGWGAWSAENLFNHHYIYRRDGVDYAKVMFTRYVDAPKSSSPVEDVQTQPDGCLPMKQEGTT